MNPIERLLQAAQPLFAGAGDLRVAADTYMDAVIAAMSYAGPPGKPIDWYSDQFKEAIVKGGHGRAQFSAASWVTYPWTCVRIDIGSVPMGRPTPIPGKDGGPPAMRLDHRSVTFQRRMTAALHALELTPPHDRCVIHTAASSVAVFIAWRELDPDLDGSPDTLPGDVDNYAKNVLDGLQRARILANDKLVMRLSTIKATTAEFGILQTLTERLHADVLAACPHAEATSIEDLDAARKSAGVTRAQMHEWFAHYPVRSQGKKKKATGAKRTPRNKKANNAVLTAEQGAQHAKAFELANNPELTISEIAKMVGASSNSVAKWLKQAGIKRKRKRGFEPVEDDAKRALVEKLGQDRTLTKSDIARQAGVHRATVSRWLQGRTIDAEDSMEGKRSKALQLATENPTMSHTDIGEKVGVARSTVTRWIEKAKAS